MTLAKQGITVLAFFMFASLSVAQDVDGTLGKQVQIELTQVGNTAKEADVGDLLVINLPSKDVTRVKTDLVPDQGDAVRRVALVRVGDTITAYYAAEKVGSAQIQFEVTKVVSGVTTTERKVVLIKVNEPQQFNTVHERDLDGGSVLPVDARVGDIIKVRKKNTGLTSLKANSLNSSIVRRDAVVVEGDTYIYYFSAVGKGATSISIGWTASGGKDGGFVLPVKSN